MRDDRGTKGGKLVEQGSEHFQGYGHRNFRKMDTAQHHRLRRRTGMSSLPAARIKRRVLSVRSGAHHQRYQQQDHSVHRSTLHKRMNILVRPLGAIMLGLAY